MDGIDAYSPSSKFFRLNRVLWLLEEINLAYRLVRHDRLPEFMAPDSLKRVHRLGKAPVIVDGGQIFIESAVILGYLTDRYAGGRFAPALGTLERRVHDQWLHWTERPVAPSSPACDECALWKT
ncbi:glutathione S-transferase N-terminal domain-containing protein [Paraburkholderia caledonica]|uniref:glutathione S-transferase N-terminal domain-containing protein n=1 Tax=Paraburkholderia caledonica TaxID=134536 RepID=UPI00339B01E3